MEAKFSTTYNILMYADPDTECGGVSDIGNAVADALLKMKVKSIKLDGE